MADNIQNLKSYQFKSHFHLYQRIGHRVILYGKKIFVFGGVNLHNDFVTPILNIDCETYEVSQLTTKNSFPVEGFSLISFANKFYFWGGRRPNGDDLFTKISQKGEIPSPRQFHCWTKFAKKFLIVYGGQSDQTVFNDWHALDLQTLTWVKMEANINLSLNNQPKLVWLETRGVLAINQIINQSSLSIQPSFQLFQVKIRKNPSQQLFVYLQQLEVDFLKQKMQLRSSPTLCKYQQTDSSALNLAIIGGQRLATDKNSFNSAKTSQLMEDVHILNLETLQCQKVDKLKLASKLGHEAIFYRDRILLVGGILSINQFSSNLEVIDLELKFISIDRKLCKTCQVVYGLEHFSKSKLSIKCEYQSPHNVHIPAKMVQKFSQTIQNPLKAIGLLIDNSMNMNASKIQLQFKDINFDPKLYLNPNRKILILYDNSYGFSKEEILESYFSFGYKTETFTHDIKFEEELAVRKQYGLNLKLAAMKLGTSCLFLTSTIDEDEKYKFIGYFSIDDPSFKQNTGRFQCFYYFINSRMQVSSQLNRKIIEENIFEYINLQELEKSRDSRTKVFIFNFNRKNQFKIPLELNQKNSIHCPDFLEQQGEIFSNIEKYLQYLYLKPNGRTITISGKVIHFNELSSKLKQYEMKQIVQKLNLGQYSEEISKGFVLFNLYQILKKQRIEAEIVNKVLIYSNNRLIQSFDYNNAGICGIVELRPFVEIGIGKCTIQNHLEQKQIYQYIKKVLKSGLTRVKQVQQNRKRSQQYLIKIKEDQDKQLGIPQKKIK